MTAPVYNLERALAAELTRVARKLASELHDVAATIERDVAHYETVGPANLTTYGSVTADLQRTLYGVFGTGVLERLTRLAAEADIARTQGT